MVALQIPPPDWHKLTYCIGASAKPVRNAHLVETSSLSHVQQGKFYRPFCIPLNPMPRAQTPWEMVFQLPYFFGSSGYGLSGHPYYTPLTSPNMCSRSTAKAQAMAAAQQNRLLTISSAYFKAGAWK